MLPIFRIAPRVSNICTKCVFASSQASTRPIVQRHSGPQDTATDMDGTGRSMIEGYQDEIADFSLTEARRVMARASNFQSQGPSVQGVQESYAQSQQQVCDFSSQDAHAAVYDSIDSCVNLNSSMQDTVPHPHLHSVVPGYGSHFSMPDSGRRTLDKFASASMQNFHPSRHFSTSSRLQSSSQAAAVIDHDEDSLLADPSPQGIQGDNCINFKLWMENCQRYNLPNCDEQMESIRAGRKTLSQVFLEQQEIIQRVASDYRKQQMASKQSVSSVQGLQDSCYNFEFGTDDPCPQGLQGDACADYKFWAYNCKLFGFGDCSEKAHDIAHGRRTLQDVFIEQDMYIRKIVNDYKEHNRKYSTDSRSQSSSEVGKSVASDSSSNNKAPSNSTPPNDNEEKDLSQRARLKRAVKEYGGTVIVFHIGISLLSLGGFYAAVSSGLDVVGMLSKLGVGESILQSRLATGSTTFVVAYAVHKVFAPVRIGITLTCTPLIVRHLRKIGVLKPSKLN